MNEQTTHDEADRLRTLSRYHVLDTPAEDRFDAIVKLTASVFDVPIVTFSLIDEKRCWFKSKFGLEVGQIRRDMSLCSRVVENNAPLVIENVDNYPEYADNALVKGPPYVSFYAGIPVRASSREPLGSFCVIDTKPRQFPWEDFKLLQKFALQIEEQLEARLSERRSPPDQYKH